MGDYDATYAFTYEASMEETSIATSQEIEEAFTPTLDVSNYEITLILQSVMQGKIDSGAAIPSLIITLLYQE